MKTIIAGSRTITDYGIVVDAIRESGFNITEVVSGGARGVDRLGEQWADCHNVPVRKFLPDWDAYGKAAGMIRNHQMGDYAEALVAVRLNHSRGTTDMINYARNRGLKVFVKEIST